MDDDYFLNTEKQSIRESARSLKKYGSTCNHVRNNEFLLRHELLKTDTLQGIALKYGCTTEQIRRANRLFAQDSLFLRQFLMIPVSKDSQYYPNDDRPHSLMTATAAVASNSTDEIDSAAAGSGKATVAAAATLSPEEENRKDINDFLGKIDSNLAETRRYVAKSQNSFDYMADSDNMFTANRRSTSSHHVYYHSSGNSSSSNGSSTGLNNNNDVMQMSQGRRVQSSLQRLEKQQDEFFEL